MPTCRLCSTEFPSSLVINGKRHILNRRTHCLQCVPLGTRLPQGAGSRSWSDAQLVEAVGRSTTVSDVLRSIGLSVLPGNFRTVYHHIARLGLDTTHFKGKGHGRSRHESYSLSDILVEASTYQGSLRRRLMSEGVLDEHCYECKQPPTWNGKPLVLQLDHINGCPTDNRIENLRLLCPNCHTQTPTFTSRGLRLPAKKCPGCGVPIHRKSNHCTPCAGRVRSSGSSA